MSESARHIAPEIQAAIDRVEMTCANRARDVVEPTKLIVIEHDRALVDIVGPKGGRGRLGVVEKKAEQQDARLTAVERAVWKVTVGAATGGGAVAVIIEAIKRMG